MKYFPLILLFISSFDVKSNPTDTIKTFDLVINEVYGCFTHDPFYVNYHYENNVFSITYSGKPNPLRKQVFSKKDFANFYDTLSSYNFKDLDAKYRIKRASSASHPGELLVSVNNRLIKHIYYTTKPDDSTNFMYMYNWLFKKAKSIDQYMDLKLLLSTKYYSSKYPIDGELAAIEINKTNFRIEDIFKVIDTTTNVRLKESMIRSLALFKDERITTKLGEMLLKNINRKDSVSYGDRCYQCSMLELKPILAQDSSSNKIDYLRRFLKSKSDIVRVESAMALAQYGLDDGTDIILNQIKENIKTKIKIYQFIGKECYSLLFIANDFVIKELQKQYHQLKAKKLNEDYWMMRNIIYTINLMLDKKTDVNYDTFTQMSGKIDLEKEMKLLDSRLAK